jgi:hypothetical protein
MTYDRERLFLEFLPDGELVLTSLRTERTVPLIRYKTGDRMELLNLTDEEVSAIAGATDLKTSDIRDLRIVLCKGRVEGAVCGSDLLTAEQVKEGLYAEADLAAKTTCNFRIIAGERAPLVRVQLSPGVSPSKRLNERFADAIGRYTDLPPTVRCEPYETFQDGMTLDYERKFDYLAQLSAGRRMTGKDAPGLNGMDSGSSSTGVEHHGRNREEEQGG